ncbi:MAG: SIMPL domain-containing protein [Alphaproteobacteria bacterium]|jgi:uncharacterized protein YggE|nr:SIMPL domain-containing protein [Alphaproteobacteria bacterium]
MDKNSVYNSKTFVISAAIVLIVAIGHLSSGSKIHSKEQGTISVSGECTREVIADKHKLDVYLEVTSENAKEANDKVQASYKALLEKIKKVDDLEFSSSNYSVRKDEDWTWDKEEKKDILVFKGYKARIEFDVDTYNKDRIAEAVALISSSDDAFIQNLSTYISKEFMTEIRDDCTEEALLDAKEKAEFMAETLDQRVDDVKSISVYSRTPRGNFMVNRKMEDVSLAMEMDVPEFFDSKENLTFNANVVFFLK